MLNSFTTITIDVEYENFHCHDSYSVGTGSDQNT